MSKKISIISIVGVAVLALFLRGNLPQLSREEKCDVKSFRQLTKSKKQICVKVGESYEFVAVLTLEDIYSYTDFCLKVVEVSGEVRTPLCGAMEDYAQLLSDKSFPKDACIDYLRNYVFKIVDLRDESSLTSEEIIESLSEWSGKAKFYSNCYPPPSSLAP